MTQPFRKFSSDWFATLTAPLWTKHFVPVRHQIDHYLEIGCWEGASVLWTIDHLHPSLAITIDPYAPIRRRERRRYAEVRATAEQNLAPEIAEQRVQLVLEHSRDYLRSERRPPDGWADMVFVDGSHEARDCMEDMVLTWPLLRRGGYLVLDDVQRRWLNGRPWSHQATKSWLECYETLYDYLYATPKQIALVKR